MSYPQHNPQALLETIRFFDVQQQPLTALEVWNYLLPENNSRTYQIFSLAEVVQLLDQQ